MEQLLAAAEAAARRSQRIEQLIIDHLVPQGGHSMAPPMRPRLPTHRESEWSEDSKVSPHAVVSTVLDERELKAMRAKRDRFMNLIFAIVGSLGTYIVEHIIQFATTHH